MAYVTKLETILFARNHVLLDNQASVNVFSNADLLTNITGSEHGIILNGVDKLLNVLTSKRKMNVIVDQ